MGENKMKKNDVLFYVVLFGIGLIIPTILTFMADLLLMRVTNCNVIISSIFAVLCGVIIFKTCIQILVHLFIYTAKKMEKDE